MSVCRYICMQYMYACMYICMYMYVCMYTYVRTCTYIASTLGYGRDALYLDVKLRTNERVVLSEKE
jgi:hypothetical protein